MNFIRTEIPDVIICEPEVHGDSRGYFMESFRRDRLETFMGRSVDFCQDNESRSSRGVLRGLHYQLPPFAQTKLVRVIEGRVLDVSVDIRQGSPTFGKHIAVELSGENKRLLFIPRGFAHGFVVLSETALFSYKTDQYYNPESERGIAFNDPGLAIDWQLPENELKLSAKDLKQPLFEEAAFFDFNTDLYG
ncbi:dTDP-4-dehydrorhamnose 3,5-epimerase [Sinomicrobium weinanense]|uniref:dTDP-4-dehydrorhamnose 3,5-epimerase n=1 Tax=Sinomicrobium weinanense TaxID=2842200 RepID=A0A926Q2L5_9FLAO|nr:dTDP-4-dehydrorhamnose 3,5-epimerase [Sinomicrobium weinanense]MBC9795056.1 dTDP-4-dehydrorhamnose 3,5-epimerase [Sinomicrobium weinanense]MBU3123815.1 dTDP-4-dehydrorhamnose 3,5-epimerase [Sinomicrobium weinanense]